MRREVIATGAFFFCLNQSNYTISSIRFLVVFLISPETSSHHPQKMACTNKTSTKDTALKPSWGSVCIYMLN